MSSVQGFRVEWRSKQGSAEQCRTWQWRAGQKVAVSSNAMSERASLQQFRKWQSLAVQRVAVFSCSESDSLLQVQSCPLQPLGHHTNPQRNRERVEHNVLEVSHKKRSPNRSSKLLYPCEANQRTGPIFRGSSHMMAATKGGQMVWVRFLDSWSTGCQGWHT